MKLERLHITAFVDSAALIWLVLLLFQGTPISLAHARPFSIVVSSLVGLGLLFEFVLWRQPWLHGWFVKRPDLRGTWRVELQSSYVRPETDERVLHGREADALDAADALDDPGIGVVVHRQLRAAVTER